MNRYIAYYKGIKYEVYGDNALEAREKAIKKLKPRKNYEVTIMLAEKE